MQPRQFQREDFSDLACLIETNAADRESCKNSRPSPGSAHMPWYFPRPAEILQSKSSSPSLIAPQEPIRVIVGLDPLIGESTYQSD